MVQTSYRPVPVALGCDGRYDAGVSNLPRWTYGYSVEHPRTPSERRLGSLMVDGKGVGPLGEGERVQTPWGPMSWSSDAHSSGWLLVGPRDLLPARPGELVVIAALPANGRWSAVVERWTYTVEIAGAHSKAERRAGTLTRDGTALEAGSDGDTVETPWGACRWAQRSGYEQGWLFMGCYDRPWGT